MAEGEENWSHPNGRSLLPGFSFTVDELSQFSSIAAPVVENVLVAFTIPPGEKNHSFRSLHDFNIANAMPLLRTDAKSYLLFQEYSIAEALYDSPFYWMCGDDAYRSTAMLHRGRFTEDFSRERLERVFGKDNVHANVDIYESKGKKVGEIDVLVIFGNRAIVLQAKSKKLTEPWLTNACGDPESPDRGRSSSAPVNQRRPQGRVPPPAPRPRPTS
jgi:hypothetical protein